MSDDFKGKYQEIILESGLEEALITYREKIIENRLDDEETAELMERLHFLLVEIIKFTLCYYSHLVNEQQICDNLNEYVDMLSLSLLKGGCDCSSNRCYQQHTCLTGLIIVRKRSYGNFSSLPSGVM